MDHFRDKIITDEVSNLVHMLSIARAVCVIILRSKGLRLCRDWWTGIHDMNLVKDRILSKGHK